MVKRDRRHTIVQWRAEVFPRNIKSLKTEIRSRRLGTPLKKWDLWDFLPYSEGLAFSFYNRNIRLKFIGAKTCFTRVQTQRCTVNFLWRSKKFLRTWNAKKKLNWLPIWGKFPKNTIFHESIILPNRVSKSPPISHSIFTKKTSPSSLVFEQQWRWYFCSFPVATFIRSTRAMKKNIWIQIFTLAPI